MAIRKRLALAAAIVALSASQSFAGSISYKVPLNSTAQAGLFPQYNGTDLQRVDVDAGVGWSAGVTLSSQTPGPISGTYISDVQLIFMQPSFPPFPPTLHDRVTDIPFTIPFAGTILLSGSSHITA